MKLYYFNILYLFVFIAISTFSSSGELSRENFYKEWGKDCLKIGVSGVCIGMPLKKVREVLGSGVKLNKEGRYITINKIIKFRELPYYNIEWKNVITEGYTTSGEQINLTKTMKVSVQLYNTIKITIFINGSNRVVAIKESYDNADEETTKELREELRNYSRRINSTLYFVSKNLDLDCQINEKTSFLYESRGTRNLMPVKKSNCPKFYNIKKIYFHRTKYKKL